MRANFFPAPESQLSSRSIDLLVTFINSAYTSEADYRSLTANAINERVNDSYITFIWNLEQLPSNERRALKSASIPLEPNKTVESVIEECTRGCFRDRCHFLASVVLAQRPENHQIKSVELVNLTLKQSANLTTINP